ALAQFAQPLVAEMCEGLVYSARWDHSPRRQPGLAKATHLHIGTVEADLDHHGSNPFTHGKDVGNKKSPSHHKPRARRAVLYPLAQLNIKTESPTTTAFCPGPAPCPNTEPNMPSSHTAEYPCGYWRHVQPFTHRCNRARHNR